MANVHERNATETVTILALTFLAGIASNEDQKFLVEPATQLLDLKYRTDLIIHRKGPKKWTFLCVDGTSSFKYKDSKIRRAVGDARKGRAWRFILKGEWDPAIFEVMGTGNPGREKCFQASVSRLHDGKPAAFSEACPIHGNSCEFAKKLFNFANSLNRQFKESKTQARYFAMNVKNPPF